MNNAQLNELNRITRTYFKSSQFTFKEFVGILRWNYQEESIPCESAIRDYLNKHPRIEKTKTGRHNTYKTGGYVNPSDI